MSAFLKYIYSCVPDTCKLLYSRIPFSLRAGRDYRKYMNMVKVDEFASEEHLNTVQLGNMQALLSHCYNNVPYYRHLFDTKGISPSDFSNLRHLENLPILDKKTVFDNYEGLTSRKAHNLNTYVGFTGGTTGNPLKILFDIRSHFIEWAFIHSSWKRVGFSPSNRRVALLGVPFRKDKVALWKHNHPHNELQLSPRNMTRGDLERYCRLINEYKPDYIYGLPSAITVLALFLVERGIYISGIKGILCGSENMSQQQRKLLSDSFSARVYTWYGQTEKVVLGAECEYSSDYHLFPEYGYTELVDDGGRVIHEPGRIGEIVGTGFINFAMPLIRYRTGDFGEYVGGDCACGRRYRRIKNVVGRRISGKIYGDNGSTYLFSSIETQKGVFEKIYKCQFYQDKPGYVVVNVMSGNSLGECEMRWMAENLAAQVDHTIHFEIKVVHDLMRTENGKTPSLIQLIES